MSKHTPSEIIHKDNIRSESYYNLCRIQSLTHYADPIAAACHARKVFRVTRDENRNILTANEILPQTEQEKADADAFINAADI